MATARRLRHSRRRNVQEEAIEEILVRLPVKSLMRCKCVCKGWNALIGSKRFVKFHHEHESNKEKLLVRHCKTQKGPYSFALFEDEKCSEYEEPGVLQMPKLVEAMMGPVNGVFLVIGVSDKMALLNPALKQFMPLPECDTWMPHCMFSLDDVIGFGQDERTGVFKVVTIKYYWQKARGHIHYPPIVSIYRSSTNSWSEYDRDKVVFKPDHCAYGSVCKTYMKGVYYWVVESGDSNVSAVLAFNMASERFREIKVPESVVSRIGHLTLYNDSTLALLSYDFVHSFKCDIWVMKEGERSWSKLTAIGPFIGIGWPICFWKNDEILFQMEDSFLTLHSVTTGESRATDVHVKENDNFLNWTYRYKESILSLKDVGRNCVHWDVHSDFIKFLLKE